MKKLFYTLSFLVLFIAFASSKAVKADVLWEPYGDTFYENFKGTKYVEQRTYIANSEKGYAVLYESPDSRKTSGYLVNGEEISIYWVYEIDGHKWGQSSSDSLDYIKLDDCIVKYDYMCFNDEYKDSIQVFNSYEDSKAVQIEDGALCYDYPGSDVLFTFYGGADEYVSRIYVDENGNEWAYFTYVMGRRHFWINLNDQLVYTQVDIEKESPKLYAGKVPTEEDLKQSAKLDVTAPTKDRLTLFFILIGTCVVAVFATVCIHHVLKRAD